MMTIHWFEIRRKVAHILFGLICMLLIYIDFLEWWMMLIVLAGGLLLSYASAHREIPLIRWFLKIFDRPTHLKTVPGRGALGSALGVMLAILLFEKNITLAAIAIWTFGDGIAALIGMHFGRLPHPLNKKLTIEGTLAGIAAASLAALVFVSASIAFIASFIAMIFESIEIRIGRYEIDDNIVLPLIAGTVIYLLMMVI